MEPQKNYNNQASFRLTDEQLREANELGLSPSEYARRIMKEGGMTAEMRRSILNGTPIEDIGTTHREGGDPEGKVISHPSVPRNQEETIGTLLQLQQANLEKKALEDKIKFYESKYGGLEGLEDSTYQKLKNENELAEYEKLKVEHEILLKKYKDRKKALKKKKQEIEDLEKQLRGIERFEKGIERVGPALLQGFAAGLDPAKKQQLSGMLGGVSGGNIAGQASSEATELGELIINNFIGEDLQFIKDFIASCIRDTTFFSQVKEYIKPKKIDMDKIIVNVNSENEAKELEKAANYFMKSFSSMDMMKFRKFVTISSDADRKKAFSHFGLTPVHGNTQAEIEVKSNEIDSLKSTCKIADFKKVLEITTAAGMIELAKKYKGSATTRMLVKTKLMAYR